jgi:hypothetical protein
VFNVNARRAGWIASLLIAPHLVLGTWLTLVPDYLAFTANQVVVLLHVALALMAVPVLIWLTVKHLRGMQAPKAREGTLPLVIRWGLTLATFVAVVTGVLVLRGGDIIAAHPWHTWGGVAVTLPFAAHLWMSEQRKWALASLVLLGLAAAGSLGAKQLLPPDHVEAVTPEFAYKTRPTELYEPAEACGYCHVQDFNEWKRSTHARTLEHKAVREGFVKFKESVGFDLDLVGKIIGGAKPDHFDQAIFSCEMCHSPTSFYGDDKINPMVAKNVSSEGVTCSFCHTLRQVVTKNSQKLVATDLHQKGTIDLPNFLPGIPQFVSAPETVRRYLGQGSKSPVARLVADWLIRWRPSVHSHDYHAPVLDESESCMPCHSMGMLDAAPEIPRKVFISWRESTYHTNDPKTNVSCMDCHMSHKMTGKPVHEWVRQVPWGPLRPGGVSHQMIGGDVTGSQDLGDKEMAKLQHEMNKKAVKIAIRDVVPQAEGLDVTVLVSNEMVGHYFPGMETHNRYAWVEIRALDAGGQILAATAKPKSEEDFGGESPLIFRCTQQPKPECDTLIPAKGSREFKATVKLPAGAKAVNVEALLHFSLDPTPLSIASRPLAI